GTHEGEIISEHADGKSYCWSTYTLLDTGETAYFQETMPESHRPIRATGDVRYVLVRRGPDTSPNRIVTTMVNRDRHPDDHVDDRHVCIIEEVEDISQVAANDGEEAAE
ncbi:MAG: hypothetical protein ACHREM_31720, partial [Polyangiales bacterium]